MASNNFSVLFWLYKSKQNKQGDAPLYLRVTFKKDRWNVATGFTLAPSRWDLTKNIVRGSKPDAQQINDYISHTKARLMELFNAMLRERDINLDVLMDRFYGKDVNNSTLLQLVEYHNTDFKARIGIDYTFSTYEKYDILKRKLEAFIPHAYQKKDIRLKDLTPKFLTDFDFYLKKNDKNLHNTATKYLKNLKKIINVGVTINWLDENPFLTVKSSYKGVDRGLSDAGRIRCAEAKQFSISRLNLVRDLFLFQCYTGLAYSDMARLTIQNVSPGIDCKYPFSQTVFE